MTKTRKTKSTKGWGSNTEVLNRAHQALAAIADDNGFVPKVKALATVRREFRLSNSRASIAGIMRGLNNSGLTKRIMNRTQTTGYTIESNGKAILLGLAKSNGKARREKATLGLSKDPEVMRRAHNALLKASWPDGYISRGDAVETLRALLGLSKAAKLHGLIMAMSNRGLIVPDRDKNDRSKGYTVKPWPDKAASIDNGQVDLDQLLGKMNSAVKALSKIADNEDSLQRLQELENRHRVVTLKLGDTLRELELIESKTKKLRDEVYADGTYEKAKSLMVELNKLLN